MKVTSKKRLKRDPRLKVITIVSLYNVGIILIIMYGRAPYIDVCTRASSLKCNGIGEMIVESVLDEVIACILILIYNCSNTRNYISA